MPLELRQFWALLSVSLILWTLWGLPVFGAFAVCYLVAWLAFNALAPLREHALRFERLLWVGGLLCLGAQLYRAPTIIEVEQLAGRASMLMERARLQRTPSIAPAMITDDRPQRFYVYAPGARTLKVRFADSVEPQTRSLSQGVFRVRYDPREHGVVPPGAKVQVTITADGRAYTRALSSVHWGLHPRWGCADRFAAFLSEESDQLLIVDEDGRVQARSAGDGPFACATRGARLYVAHRHDAALWSYSSLSRAPRKIALPGPATSIALSPSGRLVAVSHRARTATSAAGLRVFSAADHRLLQTRALDEAPDWMTFAGEDELVLAQRARRSVALLGLSAGARRRAPIFLGRPVVSMVRRNDGMIALAVTDYRPADDAGDNHSTSDQLVFIDPQNWVITKRVKTSRRSQDRILGASPMGLWPVGARGLLVSFAGTDEVWRYEGEVPTEQIWRRGEVSAPHAVVQLTSGTRVVASPASGKLHLLAQGRGRSWPKEAPQDSLQRAGEIGFWEATRSGISCQTCHLHGGTDHAMHDIGHARPRLTLTVRGVAKTAPYLRGASYHDLKSLDRFAKTVLGGYHRAAPDRALALATFVSALPPAWAPALDATRARAGVNAFFKGGCAGCHAPPAFTDLSAMPVRFLFPASVEQDRLLDVPALIGASQSPPFLQDGRAKSLRAVLEDAQLSERHGDLAALSPSQRDALLLFLESL